MKKIIYLSLILIFVISMNLIVLAENSISNLNSQINQAENELSKVQAEKTAALKEIEEFTNKIADLEAQISEMNVKIDALTSEIQVKQKDIEEKEKEYQERQALLNKRLVAVYQSGKTTYLDVLLSSSSITDFISNYYLLEQITEYDTELLEEIQNLKTQIESEKASLEADKTQIEEAKKTIEENKASLEIAKAEKNEKVASLSAEEKSIQSEIDEFERDKMEILAEAARVASVYVSSSEYKASISSSSTSSVSTGGFISPVPGRSKSDITTGFYGYYKHGGADFARNSKGAVQGLPVVAAKAGTVVKSISKKNSSGNYISYGEYIQIAHADGTSTLYAHMQPGSRKVEKGDYVTQGQQIGNIGMTGNASGYHLHFELMINGKPVDPANYLP